MCVREATRWVTQTLFYDPSQPPEVCTGNCTEAALASLFGIRLEDVPSMQGLVASDYWDALEAFVLSRGYGLSMQPANHRPAGLYLADGPSARGCGHFVVMRDGKMVHDPHPSRAGLLEIERVWSLMVLDPADQLPKWRTDWPVMDGGSPNFRTSRQVLVLLENGQVAMDSCCHMPDRDHTCWFVYGRKVKGWQPMPPANMGEC